MNTLKFIGLLQLYFDSDHDTLPLDRKGSLHNDVRLDSHENLTKHEGGWVGSAEHDVLPKVNLWYEFSNCCCQRNRYRMCRLQKMSTALLLPLLILTEIVEA